MIENNEIKNQKISNPSLEDVIYKKKIEIFFIFQQNNRYFSQDETKELAVSTPPKSLQKSFSNFLFENIFFKKIVKYQ